jgi:hypothetical protein
MPREGVVHYIELGFLSDEKFDRLASESGQRRSPKQAGRCRICRRLLLGFCDHRRIRRYAENPDLAAMMNPASRELLGNDRSTSETGPRSDEAMDGAQFRNLVDFLGRPTTIDRCVDAMGQCTAGDIASDRAVRCPIDGTSQLRKSAHAR